MKSALNAIVLLSLLSFTAIANEVEIISGSEAENIFQSLESNFEYRYSAIVTGLRIDTTVRHNNEIKCTREITTYQNQEPIKVITCEEINK